MLRMPKVWTISLPQHLKQETLDFENLDFNIASGLRKILTGNKSPQQEEKLSRSKRSLMGRQIAWMIYDFFNIRGDNEVILDFRDLSKVQSEQRQRSSFQRKVGRSIIGSH